MASSGVAIHPNAYVTAVLHAFKHPSAAVSGLLLGKVIEGKKGAAPRPWVEEAFPLFHFQSNLSAMFDVGFLQAEMIGKERGLQVIGYYAANELLDDDRISQFAQNPRLISRFGRGTPAVHWQIVNTRVIAKPRAVAVRCYRGAGERWEEVNTDAVEFINDADTGRAVPELNVHEQLQNSIERSVFRQIVDLDDHLENIELDPSKNSALVV
eukprot:TRINITY_DN93801_c0_g1_i1.p1 TRINITY_DN93801_c0_g1~~TRINITY_DN93801_c0_g1_i1.p1  ORF type:complete len:224 (+),score=44.05 TRINITY_DN93801_c0_g1_i1:40-672(+)